MKKIALIPAYEPEPVLLQILTELRQANFQIIVIDDGSGDDYNAIFEEAKKYAIVITHPVNHGKGSALKTGLSYLRENFQLTNDTFNLATNANSPVIVTMDADGQHTVADANKLCVEASKHTESLVLGCRKHETKTMSIPLRSRFGNFLTRKVYRLLTGVNIYDTQTGLRAFTPQLVEPLLHIPGERYEYEMNVLLRFGKAKVPIREIEIQKIYLDNNSSSHFKPIRDSAKIYKQIFKFSLSSLLSFAVDYTLFTLFCIITSGLGSNLSLRISNVGARIISAAFNYALNRQLVFKSNSSIRQSIFRYMFLASFILIGNTLTLSLLVELLGLNKFVAKLFTEMMFFCLSFTIQQLIVFRKESDYVQ